MNVLRVLLQRLGKDEDVVNVNKHKTVYHVAAHIVHKRLENSWRVGETKGHDHVLEMTQGCIKSCLLLVTAVNAHQVV